jgi:hypothetical protein
MATETTERKQRNMPQHAGTTKADLEVAIRGAGDENESVLFGKDPDRAKVTHTAATSREGIDDAVVVAAEDTHAAVLAARRKVHILRDKRAQGGGGRGVRIKGKLFRGAKREIVCVCVCVCVCVVSSLTLRKAMLWTRHSTPKVSSRTTVPVCARQARGWGQTLRRKEKERNKERERESEREKVREREREERERERENEVVSHQPSPKAEQMDRSARLQTVAHCTLTSVRKISM